MHKLLIANRGEIALRLQRAARDLGIATVAVYAGDDARARHRVLADEAVALPGQGPSAYMDVDEILRASASHGCDAVHPGYGFLSERADFATACVDAGVTFVGPTAEQLSLFGDKARARVLAADCQVPVMPATRGDASLDEIAAFFDAQDGAGVVIKAAGGGGGRGMRVVRDRRDLPEAYARCRSEARSAFGVESVYGERLVARARHVEVQIAGDGAEVVSLGERDCTLQRRFQKLVEIAPSPVLAPALRERIVHAARTMAARVGYLSLGTFEFLVEEDTDGTHSSFVFIEVNPRLQVEHTVTEQVTGVDLVATQLGIASGRALRELGLDPEAPPRTRGYAIQARVNAESIDAQGAATPALGRLERFDPPAGPDVRVDTDGYAGYERSPNYDSLLAKVVVTSTSDRFGDAVRRLQRALAEFRISGVETNIHVLRALAERDDFETQRVHTRYVESVAGELADAAARIGRADQARDAALDDPREPHPRSPDPHVDETPLAEGMEAVRAPFGGRLIELAASNGDIVAPGATVAVLEAMKMEHSLVTRAGGRIVDLRSQVGDQATKDQILLVLESGDAAASAAAESETSDPRAIRPDLQRVIDRHRHLYDEARPTAVAKRRSRGQRTARENVADLCDDGSFVEYGGLAVAAQASRRSDADLVANTPADGLVTGIGGVNGALFGAQGSRCAVLAYDATVLAGTQGHRNHAKTDRMIAVAAENGLPVVLFAEGGGGRPGDVDIPMVAGVNIETFREFAALVGEVPVVGIVSGFCFAGNAALLGCCDVIIATRNASIGMAGPPMIEGGGLGTFRAEEVGPASVQHGNGVVDLLVEDEAAAVAAAKHYLSMFQGDVDEWETPDPLLLRGVVPESRVRSYDTRAAIAGLADVGSVLALRTGFGAGMHTALARIEGRAVGIVANDPRHLGGAIDPEGADKMARFLELCDAHGLPIVSLIDTPGFMVGPETEARAQVRRVCRLFVLGARLGVPLLTVVLRKSYGLGAMAMAGGSFRAPSLTISWPTGEFGPMGLEGAVRLGFRKELEDVPEGPERDALFAELLTEMYDRGHAISAATLLEIDAVIDPADTRRWLVTGLEAAR